MKKLKKAAQHKSKRRKADTKLIRGEETVFSSNDKLYIQTSDIPTLKEKISRAIELSRELKTTLDDLENYNIKFEINEKREEK